MSKKTFDAAKDSQIPRRRSIYGDSRLSSSIKRDKSKASDVAASVTESTTASNDKTSSPGKSLAGKAAAKLAPGIGAASAVYDAYTIPMGLMSKAGASLNKTYERESRKKQERAIYKASKRSQPDMHMSKQPQDPGV